MQRRETCDTHHSMKLLGDTHHSMKLLEAPHAALIIDAFGDIALVIVWADIPGPQSRDILIGIDGDQNQKQENTGRVGCGGAARAADLVHVRYRFRALTHSVEVIVGFGGKGQYV